MDVCFVNSHRYKNRRSCLIFYRHENVLVCELICMIAGVLFIHASNCTYYFLYHITFQARSIEMYLIFILLCSLHSSVLCGLPLDMCDRLYLVCCLCQADVLHTISYASDCTIFLSSRWDAPRASRIQHSKVHDFGIQTVCVWCLVCISCQREIIHVVSYMSYYTLLHHCLPVDILYNWVFCSCWV